MLWVYGTGLFLGNVLDVQRWLCLCWNIVCIYLLISHPASVGGGGGGGGGREGDTAVNC